MSTVRSIFEELQFTSEQIEALGELLALTNGLSPHIVSTTAEEILKFEVSVKDLNTVFQENYFKKYRKGERQQITSDAELDAMKDKILALAKKAGFIDEVSLSIPNPDICLIYGANQLGMKQRIESFIAYKNAYPALAASKIYLLAGAREGWLGAEPLVEELLNRQNNSIKDELTTHKTKLLAITDAVELGKARTETVKYFTGKYQIAWPTEKDIAVELAKQLLKDIQYITVNAPLKKDGSRPDTFDTVIEFMKLTDASKQNVIAISNQPYITEQSIPLLLLPAKSYQVIGDAYKGDFNPALFLTSIANTVFRYKTLLEKKEQIGTEVSKPEVTQNQNGLGI